MVSLYDALILLYTTAIADIHSAFSTSRYTADPVSKGVSTGGTDEVGGDFGGWHTICSLEYEAHARAR